LPEASGRDTSEQLAVPHDRKRLAMMAIEEILDQLSNRQVKGYRNPLAMS